MDSNMTAGTRDLHAGSSGPTPDRPGQARCRPVPRHQPDRHRCAEDRAYWIGTVPSTSRDQLQQLTNKVFQCERRERIPWVE